MRRAARAESFSRVVQDETLSGYPISRIAMSSERALSWMPRSRLCVAMLSLRSKHGHAKP